jgi:4-amino-4-deoxychorismate lyase
MNATRYWIDSQPSTCLDPRCRIVQYGDGLFETLRVRRGVPQYLDRHLQRLQAGCERLQLPFEDRDGLAAEVRERGRECRDGVIKIVLGRAAGGRGYRFEAEQGVTRLVSTHPLPPVPPEHGERGVRLRLCKLRLGLQPALAGIKHLNRLEQVLARAEWRDEYDEGLLLDSNGHLVEGTMSNLFLGRDGALLTPRLDACGVAGVMRSVLIDLAVAAGIAVHRQSLLPADLSTAEEVFVCNSLIGVWPVIAVGEAFRFAPGVQTRVLQRALSQDDTGCNGKWYNE